jgi:hypothetical protein
MAQEIEDRDVCLARRLQILRADLSAAVAMLATGIASTRYGLVSGDWWLADSEQPQYGSGATSH